MRLGCALLETLAFFDHKLADVLIVLTERDYLGNGSGFNSRNLLYMCQEFLERRGALGAIAVLGILGVCGQLDLERQKVSRVKPRAYSEDAPEALDHQAGADHQNDCERCL